MFNNYFSNITDALGIKEITENIFSVSGLVDPKTIAVKRFISYRSIKRIQSNIKDTERFRLNQVSIQP